MGTGVSQEVVAAASGHAELAGVIWWLLKKVGDNELKVARYLTEDLQKARDALPQERARATESSKTGTIVPRVQQKIVAEALSNAQLNSATLKLLEFFGNDPAEVASYLMHHLEKANATLPKVPALTSKFQTLVTLTHGTFAARQGLNSTYEFELTLTDVEPGRTQEKLKALVEEMNAKFPTMKNYPDRGFQVHLSGNRDLPTYDERGDITLTFSWMLNDSTLRGRDVRYLDADDGIPRHSYQDFLHNLGLQEQPCDAVRVMGAFWWLAQGEFPANKDDIGFGNRGDPRDPFEGCGVRTRNGSSPGTAASHSDGVDRFRWGPEEGAYNGLGGVGGPPPKFKRREG